VDISTLVSLTHPSHCDKNLCTGIKSTSFDLVLYGFSAFWV